MESITSAKNEKIKNLSALLKSKKERELQDSFVIEGVRLFKDTLNTAPHVLQSIFISESSEYAAFPEKLTGHLDNVKTYIVKDSVLDFVSGTVTSQGIMAIAKKPSNDLEEILSKGKRLLLLENIQDPGNLGTMLRTAEAAGMDAIIMSSDCTDIFSPKVVRSSMGSIFRMPFIYCEDFITTLKTIKKHDITIYAAYLHGGIPYKEVDYDDKFGILIGNEGNGLTKEAVDISDKRIFIPMSGQIESLNAAIAAAILMFR